MKTQDGLLGAQPSKDLSYVAKSHRAKVVEYACLPNDAHLLVVLCQLHYTSMQPYVVWFFNVEDGGFSQGIYCDDIWAAAEAYKTRVERYGGTIHKRR